MERTAANERKLGKQSGRETRWFLTEPFGGSPRMACPYIGGLCRGLNGTTHEMKKRRPPFETPNTQVTQALEYIDCAMGQITAA